MELPYPHQFTAEIQYHDVGSDRYAYTVVYLPDELIRDLPLDQFPRLRVSGEIEEQPFASALTPVRGRWYLLLSKKQLKAINANLGDAVRVRFGIDDQDAVEIPIDLARALKQDRAMKKLWDGLTPGKQRGLAYRVSSAKQATTRQRRIKEVFEMMTGQRDERGRPIK